MVAGFVVRKYLIENGFNTHTLTEDLEWSIQKRIEGEKICFEKNAVYYDEQPTKWEQSLSQRERWVIGHKNIVKDKIFASLKNIAKKRSLESIDIFMYMFGAIEFRMILIFILNFFILNYIHPSFYGFITVFFEMTIGKIASYTFIYLITLVFSLAMLNSYLIIKKKEKNITLMSLAIFMSPVDLLSWLYVHLKAMIIPNKKWKKIKHNIKNVDFR